MPNPLLVMIGGAVGAGLRYEAGRLALRQLGGGFPWGTLGVNLAGGLLIGLLAGFMLGQGVADRPAWLLLAVGVLGGFTTFSAFGLDVLLLAQRGAVGLAGLYVAASVAGAIALTAAGWWLGRALA